MASHGVLQADNAETRRTTVLALLDPGNAEGRPPGYDDARRLLLTHVLSMIPSPASDAAAEERFARAELLQAITAQLRATEVHAEEASEDLDLVEPRANPNVAALRDDRELGEFLSELGPGEPPEDLEPEEFPEDPAEPLENPGPSEPREEVDPAELREDPVLSGPSENLDPGEAAPIAPDGIAQTRPDEVDEYIYLSTFDRITARKPESIPALPPRRGGSRVLRFAVAVAVGALIGSWLAVSPSAFSWSASALLYDMAGKIRFVLSGSPTRTTRVAPPQKTDPLTSARAQLNASGPADAILPDLRWFVMQHPSLQAARATAFETIVSRGGTFELISMPWDLAPFWRHETTRLSPLP